MRRAFLLTNVLLRTSIFKNIEQYMNSPNGKTNNTSTGKWFITSKEHICEYFKWEKPIKERKEGCVFPKIRSMFWFLRKFSISEIFNFYYYLKIHNYKTKNRNEWRQYALRWVEMYVLFWIVISINYIVFCIFHNDNIIFQNFVVIFAFYRLFDIFQSWLGNFLLGDPKLENVFRTLILTFLSYVEVIIWFTILAFINKESFRNITGLDSAWYYALSTGTIGSDIEPISGIGYTLFTIQIVFVILFLTVVISRIISIIREK